MRGSVWFGVAESARPAVYSLNLFPVATELLVPILDIPVLATRAGGKLLKRRLILPILLVRYLPHGIFDLPRRGEVDGSLCEMLARLVEVILVRVLQHGVVGVDLIRSLPFPPSHERLHYFPELKERYFAIAHISQDLPLKCPCIYPPELSPCSVFSRAIRGLP